MTSKFVANGAVMIMPVSFQSNPDTIASNAFQKSANPNENHIILQKAQAEFEKFQKTLIEYKIGIRKFKESDAHFTPDALFPNNWFCQLPDGRVFLFPMFPLNRRLECRADIIAELRASEIIDLRYLEGENEFLEGTGSLILDHKNKIGFACLSFRTTMRALAEFSKTSGYEVFSFEASDQVGREIYHTNVMMALSPRYVLLVASAVKDESQLNKIKAVIAATGRDLIEIDFEEMNNFVGNMLYLENQEGKGFWICSEKAYAALRPFLLAKLAGEATVLHSNLDTIETYGGGGARCLLAETFD